MKSLKTIVQNSMTQRAIHWKPQSGTIVPGQTFQTGVGIDVRWEDATEMKFIQNNEELTASSRIFTSAVNVENGDAMYLLKDGEDENAIKAQQPQELVGVQYIVKVEKKVSLKGEILYWEAFSYVTH